jgi:glycosyltransferase involved in cell wall biosynthesis
LVEQPVAGCRYQGPQVISVIIATSNSENVLTPTLAALVPGAATGRVREVIVADAGSTDATAEVADIAGCEFFVEPGPLAQRLRTAAARARSPWLMFLRAGVILDPSWLEECARFMQQTEQRDLTKARAAMFKRSREFDVPQSLLRELCGVVRNAFGRPHPEQGVLLSKRLYDDLGGHRDVADPEADLIGQLGRGRTVMLRSGATLVRQD